MGSKVYLYRVIFPLNSVSIIPRILGDLSFAPVVLNALCAVWFMYGKPCEVLVYGSEQMMSH